MKLQSRSIPLKSASHVVAGLIGRIEASPKRVGLGLFAIAFVILIARNPDPLLNPVMYTEDGVWIGMALSKGWVAAFLGAKPEYLVWGNMAFLWGAVMASKAICGNALSCLPESIAVASYGFYAGFATLGYVATREAIPTAHRLLLFALLLLLPLGDSSNEIIGRISNIGFLCVPIMALTWYWGESSASHGVRRAARDAILLFCAVTNPICALMLAALLAIRIARERGAGSLRRLDLLLLALVLAVFAWNTSRPLLLGVSTVTGSLRASGVVEVVFARAIVYPFVFPWYARLSDVLSASMGFAWLMTVVWAWSRSTHPGRRRLIALSSAALLLYWVATIAMRQSLTEQLGGYRTTFPDRYFMGLNALVIVITVAALAQMSDDDRPAVAGAGRLLAVLVAGGYLASVAWLFETSGPRMRIRGGDSFLDTACLEGVIPRPGQPERAVVLPIYFEGWSMRVPKREIDRMIGTGSCRKTWERFYLTDVNWTRGIARRGEAFFVPNTVVNRAEFLPGKRVVFPGGEAGRITSAAANGRYLNVSLSGQPIDPGRAGFPAEARVLDE